MFDPITTYRIQFNSEFGFRDLEKIIPYLKKLGITTVYASPIFEAVPGSSHGYDVVNPNRINPEIGTEEELRGVSSLLKENGMHWLQDIVPNHMAYHSNNEWLIDVLEKGQQSCYHHFFDIAGATDFFSGALMVPFLGHTLEDVIQKKELKLHFRGDRICLQYFDQQYPVNPDSYIRILQHVGHSGALKEFTNQVLTLEEFEDAKIYSERWHELLIQFVGLMKENEFSQNVQAALNKINANASWLQELAQKQHYRLCHWQETEVRINYRRFFTINGLICINIQHPDVFDAHHALVLKLVKEKIFDSLRIDHIDGLYDPTGYLRRLRQAVGRDVYIAVEKILGDGETLPDDWPVQGATGYEFLAQVNQLLVNEENNDVFDRLYEKVTGDKHPVHEQVLTKKRFILETYMQGEWQNLFDCFMETGAVDEKTLKKTRAANIKKAIGEWLVHLPVYRFYDCTLPLPAGNQRQLKEIFAEIKQEKPALIKALNLMQQTLVSSAVNERVSDFYCRCMQFSGPLMAKGVEDTLMYSYNRFLAQNEVGDHPGPVLSEVMDFHKHMLHRQHSTPRALNTTATHDTKRGEDARARLQVLSDLPQEWKTEVQRWNRKNKKGFTTKNISPADAYWLYQAIVAHLPMNGSADNMFIERLNAYLEKALREAKIFSNWSQPNLEYEEALKSFASEWIEKNIPSKAFQKLFRTVANQGVLHSLHQLILKFTCPGVPDVYQGTEFWDFSFVDPDNRRAVDYRPREELLARMETLSPSDVITELWEKRSSGEIKLFVLKLLTQLRQQQPDLWSEGEYIPLPVTGRFKNQILCFARKKGNKNAIVAIPLHTASLSQLSEKDFRQFDWKDTAVRLPNDFPTEWLSLFSEQTYKGQKLFAKNLFASWPFSILEATGEQTLQRSAGVLLSITSLPSKYGLGDIGPEARRFAGLLHDAGQSWWQILPVNPIEAGQGYSPYSATSGMAGNPLLISPQQLVEDDWLSPADLEDELEEGPHINYAAAEKLKFRLLKKAFRNFQKSGQADHNAFAKFCKQEKKWLDDFAAYSVIKQMQKGEPWYQWPKVLRLRQKGFLNFTTSQKQALEEVKWFQYIFFRQWKQFRMHCHRCGIRIIGDLPFYVSYDSADVWSNREYFALDKQGNITGVAGVPPDAFSDDGQLWGMPVYNWQAIQKDYFQWWKERLAINLRLYDIVRIDHFRALESYWVVTPGESTAKNGSWQKAPGRQWLQAMQEYFGQLPFLAEDLGDVNEAVFHLRDQFKLPGMKVLQFAFGKQVAASPHIPHNFVENAVVYTGTHDNNTSRGWFEKDIAPEIKKQVAQYTGQQQTPENISETLIRLAYGSVARLAIIPLQDVLSLNHTCRINTPATAGGNWTWRLQTGELNPETLIKLKQLAHLFGR